MGSCCSKRASFSRQGRAWKRRQVPHRVGAVLGLFALLAMLVSHVVHLVDIAIEAAPTPATSGATLHRQSPGASTAFSITAVPRGKAHDPFFCPICKLLSQTHHVLVSTGASLSLSQHSVLCMPCSTLRYAGLDIALSNPRAPPFLP